MYKKRGKRGTPAGTERQRALPVIQEKLTARQSLPKQIIPHKIL